MPYKPDVTTTTGRQQQPSTFPPTHQVAWVAAGLRKAARDAGVDLPVDYVQRVTADGLGRTTQLGVTPLGAGVVIHTVPEDADQLPVVVGYADSGGQWLRDGRRYQPTITAAAPEPPAEAVTL